MRAALVILLALNLAACTEDAAIAVTVSRGDISERNREVIARAAAVLLDECSGIKAHLGDIEWTSADVVTDGPHLWVRPDKAMTADNAMHSNTRDFGWRRWVAFEIKVKENTKTVPNGYRVRGHHLFYDVGGSPSPGISVGKKAAALFCASSGTRSRFISTASATVVDQLRP